MAFSCFNVRLNFTSHTLIKSTNKNAISMVYVVARSLSRLCGRLNTCELTAENSAVSAILAKKSLLSRLWLVLWRSINMKKRPRSSPRRILPMSRSPLSTPDRSFTFSHRAFCRPHFPPDRDVHAWSSWLCLTRVVSNRDYGANFATSRRETKQVNKNLRKIPSQNSQAH